MNFRGVALALAALVLIVLYADVVTGLVRAWQTNDDYSHGFVVLPFCAYFVWERRRRLAVLDLQPHPCVVYGDHVLLKQVLVNLVMNAMDAMAETPAARRRVTVRSEVHGTDVRISVSDAGTGLPAQLDGRLFAPFATTKSQGIGIGLTIARSIVDAHGGAIDARNNPGGGATFTITLPCGDTPPGLSAPEGAA